MFAPKFYRAVALSTAFWSVSLITGLNQTALAAPISVGSGVDSARVLLNWPDGFVADYTVHFGTSPASTISGYDLTQSALSDPNLSLVWSNFGSAGGPPNYFLNVAGYTGGHYGSGDTYDFLNAPNNYWAEWTNANDGSGWQYGNGASADIFSNGQSIGWVFGSTSTPVPEPISLGLAGLASFGGALLLGRRTRRRVGTAVLMLGCGAAMLSLPLTANADYTYNANDFATSVVSSSVSGANPYSNPSAILGQPTLMFNNSANPNVIASERAKIVEAPINYDLNGGPVLTQLPNYPGITQVTVQMGTPITDNPAHLYGADLIVFGNSFYLGAGSVSDASNLNSLSVSGSIYSHPVQVSVSPDNVNWFSFPLTAGLQPYNAYKWDDTAAGWTSEQLNPTVPLNPAVYTTNFAGQSVASVLDAYGNSAGGTGFDLENAFNSDGLSLSQAGYSAVDYVRVASSSSGYAVVTGISAVSISNSTQIGNTTFPEPGTAMSVLAGGLYLLSRSRV